MEQNLTYFKRIIQYQVRGDGHASKEGGSGGYGLKIEPPSFPMRFDIESERKDRPQGFWCGQKKEERK